MIQIFGWDRETEDHFGKEQKIVFHVSVNGAKERAVSKAALMVMLMSLPERATEEGANERPRPLFDALRGNSDEAAPRL